MVARREGDLPVVLHRSTYSPVGHQNGGLRDESQVGRIRHQCGFVEFDSPASCGFWDDDGSIHIWDLRSFNGETPISFEWHKSPITSLEWNPNDSSVVAVSSSDDQLTIWDFSLEDDPDASDSQIPADDSVPPQLLFIHQGQQNVKELHWHRQIPGLMVSTSLTGFHIFKTINV